VIAEATDAAAEARWEHYRSGTDYEALAWREPQANADTQAGIDSQVTRFKKEGAALPATMVKLIGSYAKVAKMLDALDTIPASPESCWCSATISKASRRSAPASSR